MGLVDLAIENVVEYRGGTHTHVIVEEEEEEEERKKNWLEIQIFKY